MLTFLKWHFA